MKLSRWFLICAALAIAAACSSGSTTSVTPRSSSSSGGGAGSTAVLNKTVNFTVDIPAAAPVAPAAGKVHKLGTSSTVYLSPNTGSLTINLVAVNGVSLAQPPPAQPATNVPTSCRGSATGCHVSVSGVVAATGINTYTVTTFAGSNGEGAVVSTGVISVTVTSSGAVSTIGGDPTELALGGYVASLSVTVAPQRFTFGVAGKATIVVTPKDAAGATIVGNAQFAFPIVITVSGAGFTLSGPGLRADGTIQLIEPQAASPPIVLNYDGSGTSATITVTSQNASGGAVTAPVVTVVAPTPTPMPTSTAITTLPPITPTPIQSGQTPVPTPAPSSFYILNGVDSSVFEFSEPVNGSVDEFPRRGFAGPSLDCANGGSSYELLGIAEDPSANVYVGAPGLTVFSNLCPLNIYRFPPSFSGPGGPTPFLVNTPSLPNEVDSAFELAFDAPNGGKLDFSDDSNYNIPGLFVGRVATTGGTVNPTLGYPVKQSADEACFISPSMHNPDPNCAFGGYFDEDDNASLPFTVDSKGNLYVIAFDETNGQQTPAILEVTPPNQISAGTISAAAAYVEGPSTMMSFPNSIAFDATNDSLWVFDGGAAASSISGATPPPVAGPGAYLLEFPLSAFSGSGAQNIAPTAFLSGQSNSRFEQLNLNEEPNILFGGNSIAVGDGKIFVANQQGPFNGMTSTPPPQPYNGEIDVYSDALTGMQLNSKPPIAIYYGATTRAPIGIAFGPHGTALGSGGLAQYPRNMPALRARFFAWERRNAELARQRRASRHHR